MTHVRCARYLALLVAMLPVRPASAQQVATTFEELRRLVTPGETIYVTDARGAVSKGKLAGLSAGSLQLKVDRGGGAPPVSLPESDVNNIAVRRSDPLWNGMLIGFASGAVPVALIGAGASASAGEVIGVTAGYGCIGLLTGLLIDVLNKETVPIYVHPHVPRSTRLHISAVGSSSGAGVRVSVGF